MDKIKAPFSEAQVEALNGWQKWGHTLPFTCPTHSDEPLEARNDGWHCLHDGCGYTQDWAHDFMAKAKFCTKDHPWPPTAPKTEYWIHVDAVEEDPDYDGDKVPYACLNCGLHFIVEY